MFVPTGLSVWRDTSHGIPSQMGVGGTKLTVCSPINELVVVGSCQLSVSHCQRLKVVEPAVEMVARLSSSSAAASDEQCLVWVLARRGSWGEQATCALDNTRHLEPTPSMRTSA